MLEGSMVRGYSVNIEGKSGGNYAYTNRMVLFFSHCTLIFLCSARTKQRDRNKNQRNRQKGLDNMRQADSNIAAGNQNEVSYL